MFRFDPLPEVTSMLWHPAEDAVSIPVDDVEAGVSFERPVPGAEALFAFNHPFVYAH